MGKRQHQKDKMYITYTEWTTLYGGKKVGHTSSEEIAFKRLPFDHCCVSLQPFENPYCDRSGNLFDLQPLILYIKKYKTNPVTGEPLDVKALIKVNLHKNAENEFHCPVLFKTFTKNSHFAVIATTGNVFSMEAIEQLNIKNKNWKDLITDQAFERKDIIVLQDPNNLTKFNISDFHHVKNNLRVETEDEIAERSDPNARLKSINSETKYILEELKNDSKLLARHQKDIKTLISSKVDCVVDLDNYSINKLRKAIDLGEASLENSTNMKVHKNLIETYMKFIVFVQNQDDDMYHEDIVKYVLKAMKLGSRHARQLFPCLLDLPNLSNELMELFKTESSSVPTWMFIVWIPQLLSSLNTANCNAVSDIVLRLAETYPQALIYIYRITKENYDIENNSGNLKNTVEQLDKMLNSTLVDKFLTELSTVCVPQLYANYYLSKLIKFISDPEKLREKFDDLKNDISQKSNTFKEFKTIEQSLKKLERKIGVLNNEAKVKTSIVDVIEENSGIARNLAANKYSKLKICSQWLANFKASDWTTELEIPGLYTGESKPIVKYHAKISSFNSKISMFTSLRKPFKMVMYGNDAKEYSFLIKFGEDLRQDQRIQQLFTLANNILQNDPECQQRNLYLEQYQVVPLTTALGLIKMTENNVALRSFIYETGDEKTRKKYMDVKSSYLKWLGVSAGGNFAECHAKNFAKRSKDETNRTFTLLVNSVPADILSKAFWGISMDTESYTHLRHQFITSYATMCVVHWLLGIGDRNLDNCLILKTTGRAVGIDFGHAFGTATQHLRIPELFPFRLTPHILYLMEPLQEIGFVEHTMVHVLRALRQQKHILLSTMNIFAKEPSVDWLDLANRQNDAESAEWYPYEKIKIASRKLNGANSAAITIKELRKNAAINFEDYARVAKGDETNTRAQLPDDGLSAEDQVRCLLDHATDYNILGRMYCGLEMWL